MERPEGFRGGATREIARLCADGFEPIERAEEDGPDLVASKVGIQFGRRVDRLSLPLSAAGQEKAECQDGNGDVDKTSHLVHFTPKLMEKREQHRGEEENVADQGSELNLTAIVSELFRLIAFASHRVSISSFQPFGDLKPKPKDREDNDDTDEHRDY